MFRLALRWGAPTLAAAVGGAVLKRRLDRLETPCRKGPEDSPLTSLEIEKTQGL